MAMAALLAAAVDLKLLFGDRADVFHFFCPAVSVAIPIQWRVETAGPEKQSAAFRADLMPPIAFQIVLDVWRPGSRLSITVKQFLLCHSVQQV